MKYSVKCNTKQIYAIVLAAGFSRRFGSNKLLYEIDGQAMYFKIVGELLKVQKQFQNFTIIVVTRYEEIINSLEDKSVHVVYHPHSEQGIASSLQKGLEYAFQKQNCLQMNSVNAAYVFCVADQPYISSNLLIEFLNGFLNSQKGIGCVATQTRLGNPCIFSDAYREELMKLSGEQGGKVVVKCHMQDVYIYQVQNEQILEDIDYPLE